MKRTGNKAIDESTARWVAGSDEAGYGTWAGHLIVAGTLVERGWTDPKVTDSKKMSEVARADAVRLYRGKVKWHVVAVTSTEIDRVGVWPSLIQAHNEVHRVLGEQASGSVLHVVDGLTNARSSLSPGLVALPKADLLVPAVSLASCFAKVTQCLLMDQADTQFPHYGFRSHRGYGTPQHQRALVEYGPSPIHRFSYSSVKKHLKA